MTKQKRPAIKTQGLTKYYGQTRGIEDLDLSVEQGEIFGFLGPNGAGKSTTINLLMGFRNPSDGKALVLGKPIGPGAVELRRQIGFMPGELSLYGDMKAHALLDYFADLRGGPAKNGETGSVEDGYIHELAERFRLDLGKKVKNLSKGNKQKVALVAAWMHKPDLLILDEPTSGLDPIVQEEFHDLVHEAKRRGATVFLSSHVLSEAEHLCERVGVVKEGRLIAVERIADLHARGIRHVEVQFATKPWKDMLDRVEGIRNVRVDGKTMRFTVHGSIDKVIKLLARHRIVNLSSEPASLEEFFFDEYGEEVES
ncbi:MAG: ABC transporter ATP-binding protein [bacterium]|nr:ABC transporter ATP-binding protein [bacterium]